MNVAREAEARADVFDFMAKLNSAVPAENRRLMLAKLGTDRRVTATPDAGFAPEAVCKALVRAGVLIRAGIVTRGPVRYALAPAWSAMFDQLTGRAVAAGTLH